MSNTAIEVKPTTVSATPPSPEKSNSISPSTGELNIIHAYERFEPIFGSFSLHKRDGELCTRHINGGGLVSLEARVQASVFVGENAAVLGRAVVRDTVRVEDRATIGGDAAVSGRTRLRHESKVSGNAVLEGRISMRSHAHVGDDAHLRGMISLDYHAFVGDESRLFGNMHLE